MIISAGSTWIRLSGRGSRQIALSGREGKILLYFCCLFGSFTLYFRHQLSSWSHDFGSSHLSVRMMKMFYAIISKLIDNIDIFTKFVRNLGWIACTMENSIPSCLALSKTPIEPVSDNPLSWATRLPDPSSIQTIGMFSISAN